MSKTVFHSEVPRNLPQRIQYPPHSQGNLGPAFLYCLKRLLNLCPVLLSALDRDPVNLQISILRQSSMISLNHLMIRLNLNLLCRPWQLGGAASALTLKGLRTDDNPSSSVYINMRRCHQLHCIQLQYYKSYDRFQSASQSKKLLPQAL